LVQKVLVASYRAGAGLKQKVTVTVDAICDRDDFGNPNQVCPDFATSVNGDCICDATGNPPNNNACPALG